MIKGFKLLILSLAIVDVGQAKGMVGAGAGGRFSQDGARAVWDRLYQTAEKNAKKPLIVSEKVEEIPSFVGNWISSYKDAWRLFSFYICPHKSNPEFKAWHVAPIIISLEEQDRLPLETKNFYISMKEYCFSQGSSLSTGSIEGGVYVSAFNEEYERYIKRLEYFKRVEQDFIAKQAAKASQAGALQCNFAGEHPANRIACTIPDEAPRITRYDLAHTEEFKKWVYDTKSRGWDHTEKLEQFLAEYNMEPGRPRGAWMSAVVRAKQAAKAAQAGALQCDFAGERPAKRIACTIPAVASRITRYDLAHTEEFKKWVYDTKPRGWDHTEKLEQFLVEYNKIKQ